jgi:ABC-type amino acid transport substrate-binding protein
MADLAKQLEDLHAAVVETVKTRIENGGTRDDDGNLLEPLSNDDLRVALQLLKQNQISAAAMPSTPTADLARMAGKLNFQTLEAKAKVVPIRADDKLSA